MFEIQSKWVASVLSGRVMLPTQDTMMEDVVAFYAKLEAMGIPKRYTHRLGDSQVYIYIYISFTTQYALASAAIITQKTRIQMFFFSKSFRLQVEYFNWIAEQCGCSSVEHWREQEHYLGLKRLCTQSDTFRDQWDDDHLIAEAYEDFAKLKQSW